ncbi:QWRF motif-containing protein 2 isoform X1 [Trifolium pratense]|uniref:QWRF motif-containing protein 2 isoform X1 n=1 Tax=Trifolium pratense TaxID=57577 RepID=UPI001E690766|nr:QWRF motif-containing protein 2 isoform X1 [Trifolium pratense]
MVAAISQNPLTTSSSRTSDKDIINNNNGVLPRKKGRQISSRYMSPSPSTSTTTTTSSSTTTTTTTTTTSSSSSSRRFASPLLSRSTNSSSTPLVAPKRSQSVDRRRPRPTTPVPEATKLLVTSTRSLSVSFQGEAFSLPISKSKAKAVTPERRRVTPVAGKGDQGENSRPSDQHRWPARSRQPNHLSRSVDCSSGGVGGGGGDGEKKKVVGKVVRALQQSMVMESGRRRASFDGLGGLSLDLGKTTQLSNESSLNYDVNASDTDSVSSGSNSGVHDSSLGTLKVPRENRGIVVSSKFWQETNSRLRRLQDPGSPLSTSPASRSSVPPKNSQLKRYNSDGPVLSPRTTASPIRGNARPASPSKLWASAASSPSRGFTSPSKVRSAVASSINSNSGNSPSILSFSADVRRGKIGEDRIFDAHTLRLLYNRYVQWRFVNARADATFMVQKLNAERHLWNAWVTISELRHSVILKRIKLLLLRQKLKLTSILKGQISYLEEWSLLDRDHSSSLLGATEALKASTLRLPVVKATADVPNLKDALGSAVDVMQAMASSIYSLSSKQVEETNCLVAEILKVTSKERYLLQQCKDFLSSLAAMQVKDCSLRTHMLQLSRVPAAS